MWEFFSEDDAEDGTEDALPEGSDTALEAALGRSDNRRSMTNLPDVIPASTMVVATSRTSRGGPSPSPDPVPGARPVVRNLRDFFEKSAGGCGGAAAVLGGSFADGGISLDVDYSGREIICSVCKSSSRKVHLCFLTCSIKGSLEDSLRGKGEAQPMSHILALRATCAIP